MAQPAGHSYIIRWGYVAAVLCVLMATPYPTQGADTHITNKSDSYVDENIATLFVPNFVMNVCVPNCDAVGDDAMLQAAQNNFFSSTYLVPELDETPESGYLLEQLNDAFSTGLFVSGGGSYFNGLEGAWTNIDDAIATPGMPMAAPISMGAIGELRENFVDQTVVGYVSAWTSLGGDDHFAMNFRSQLSWDPSGADPADAIARIDQRLEQSGELGEPAFTASRQAFMQAFDIASGVNTTFDPTVNEGIANSLAQLVAQDIEGYLFSCMNCDSTDLALSGVTHAFEPSQPLDDLSMIVFSSDWDQVPTISNFP